MRVGLIELYIILILELWLDFAFEIDWIYSLIVIKIDLFKQMGANGFHHGLINNNNYDLALIIKARS